MRPVREGVLATSSMRVLGTPQRPKPPQRRTEFGCMSAMASLGEETTLLISWRRWESEKCRVMRISWARWLCRDERRQRAVWRDEVSRKDAILYGVCVSRMSCGLAVNKLYLAVLVLGVWLVDRIWSAQACKRKMRSELLHGVVQVMYDLPTRTNG